MAFQIFAASAAEAATGCLELQGKNPEIIDLNLACPAPNIAERRKSGAYLLSDLGLIAEILSAMKEKVRQPLTAKIRLGRKPDLHFLRDLSAVLEGCGVDAVTLHPRLTSEKLKRRARWEYIGFLKEMSTIPVIGNGDVKSREDCRKMFAQTGCDGVMIGRAAVQQPWIFSEICGEAQELNDNFLQKAYRLHLELINDFFPPPQALGRIKEFTWYYSKNLKFGHRFAARLQSIRTFPAALEFIEENFIKAI
jgi:tRNA-dihydrouridine synthase